MKRITCLITLFLLFGAFTYAEEASCSHQKASHANLERPIIMRFAGDGKLYLVQPGETLEQAVAKQRRGGVALQEDEESGNCYRDDIEVPDDEKEKHNWKEACKCYLVTECKPGRNESRTCKRHCKKDNCDCCAI